MRHPTQRHAQILGRAKDLFPGQVRMLCRDRLECRSYAVLK